MNYEEWWISWYIPLVKDEYAALTNALRAYAQCWKEFMIWAVNTKLLKDVILNGYYDSHAYYMTHQTKLQTMGLSRWILENIFTGACWYIQKNMGKIFRIIRSCNANRMNHTTLQQVLRHAPIEHGFDPLKPTISFYHRDPCTCGEVINLKIPKLFRIKIQTTWIVPDQAETYRYIIRPTSPKSRKYGVTVSALCRAPSDGYTRLIRKEKL